MADQSITDNSISGMDQSRSAFDDEIPPSQSAIDETVTDNTAVIGQNPPGDAEKEEPKPDVEPRGSAKS